MGTPELIYCAGKNKMFSDIALEAGYKLGAQVPCTVYHDLYFCDQDWKRPDRAAYMAALARHRPHMATVLDLEHPTQRDEVLSWAEEAAQYVGRVLVIPKYSGAADKLPRRIGGADVVLAYSVPTRFAGTEVPIWEFIGWPVHLLGGSPHAQMRLTYYLDVVSVDGNMAQLQANSARFWSARRGAKGHWVQLRDIGLGDFGTGSNAEAFRHSCRNIMEAWQCLR